MDVLTFDIEIRNRILDKGEEPDPKYTYCGGWNDKAGMGISYLGAHSSWDDKFNAYGEDRLIEFVQQILKADLVVGFNIFGFDVPLLKETLIRLGLPEKTGMGGKCYDIFWDIKKSLKNNFPKGWTLENIAVSTLGIGKSGAGAMAPVLWQDRKYVELLEYLRQDVTVEVALFNHILKEGWVSNNVVECERLELEGIKKYQ